MAAPYTLPATLTKISPSNASPQRDDIAFVKGDQVNLNYLWKNLVYTAARPVDAYDLPMYSADEVIADQPATDGLTVEDTALDGTTVGADWSGTRLAADWHQKHWHAEIRNGYISTYRMYNGWVPWYGRRPQWSWWNAASYKGSFVVDATYDITLGGTITTLILPSLSSSYITPSDTYRWDLESGTPVWDEGLDPLVDDPSGFTALRTWIGGKATVLQDYTQNTVIR